MSFSAKIREEIARITDSARHCMLAEAAALTVTGAARSDGPGQEKLRELIKRLFPEGGTSDGRTVAANERYYPDNKVRSLKSAPKKEETAGISKEALQAMHLNPVSDETVSALLLKNSCCRRAYLRGMYLAIGSMSDPQRGYHMEFVCAGEAQAAQLKEILKDFEIHAGETTRKGKQVVYIKESESISEVLNIIGAHQALMEMENLRIVKDLRSAVNRRVNCDTANIQKMLGAAARQIADIRYLQEHGGLDKLPEPLRQMAEVRLQNPDASLKDIGELLDPPVGKSGVNHRLRKLSELAEERRSEEQ